MKALIIGGNRFFGRHLAEQLLASGASLTLLNRGQHDDKLGPHVERLTCDRKDEEALVRAVNGRNWDVVFDQICYEAVDARAACRVFAEKTPLYVLTSTLSVYKPSAMIQESAFDPRTYKFTKDVPTKEDYGEGKRQAEAVFFHEGRFRVIAPRFPIVCGTDDYTGRLQFHIDHVLKREPIYFPNLDARMSYISSHDAGRSLKFLSEVDFSGPINCSSPDAISMSGLMDWIEAETAQTPILAAEKTSGDHSPYGMSEDFFPSTQKLEDLGLKLPRLETWMPDLIKTLAEKTEI